MNRKRLLLVLACVVGLVLVVACSDDSPAETTGQSQIANPASVHCEEQGYTIEIREDSNGNQYGVCKFTDDTECEEWAFFRGECRQGDTVRVQPPGPVTGDVVHLSVECSISHREQDSSTFSTEVLTLSSAAPEASADLGDLRFEGTYFSGEGSGEGRSLRVSVLEGESGAELASQLYQMSKTEPPKNEFIGGHGFTGLAYAFHPTSRTELQYWCVAR